MTPFAIRFFRLFRKFPTALVRICYRVTRLYTFYSHKIVIFSRAWLLAFDNHCVGRFLGGTSYVRATNVFQFESRGDAVHGATCLVRIQGFFRCLIRKLKPPFCWPIRPGNGGNPDGLAINAGLQTLPSGGRFRSDSPGNHLKGLL